jgi:hypothetical protein
MGTRPKGREFCSTRTTRSGTTPLSVSLLFPSESVALTLSTVTGDTHASWLLENNLDTVLEGTKFANTTLGPNAVDTNYKRGQLVEFGGTAVSSSGWGASWLNSKNATDRAATGLVANSGSLFWSEGFCESDCGTTRAHSYSSDYVQTEDTWPLRSPTPTLPPSSTVSPITRSRGQTTELLWLSSPSPRVRTRFNGKRKPCSLCRLHPNLLEFLQALQGPSRCCQAWKLESQVLLERSEVFRDR